jgi:hypothetical protein
MNYELISGELQGAPPDGVRVPVGGGRKRSLSIVHRGENGIVSTV